MKSTKFPGSKKFFRLGEVQYIRCAFQREELSVLFHYKQQLICKYAKMRFTFTRVCVRRFYGCVTAFGFALATGNVRSNIA